MKPEKFWIRLLLCLSPALAGFLFTAAARQNPAATEDWYSRGVFPVTSAATSLLGGLSRHSLAEWILLAAALYGLFLMLRLVWALRRPRQRREMLLHTILLSVFSVSLILFAFQILCAPNYSRLTFSEQSGLPVRASGAEELSALCEELIRETNAAREKITEQDGLFVIPKDRLYETAETARQSVAALSETYPFLGEPRLAPKPLVFSEALSYLNLTGFYFPFTSEANVNVHMPALELPSTMCHELAHTLGFMREDEANFIAYLACRSSDAPEFVYSGLVLALTHSMNALYSVDYSRFEELWYQYGDGLRRDYAAQGQYWKRYDTPAAEASEAINNVYLKANNQSDGTRSYGRMVDLLLADYRIRHGQ